MVAWLELQANFCVDTQHAASQTMPWVQDDLGYERKSPAAEAENRTGNT